MNLPEPSQTLQFLKFLLDIELEDFSNVKSYRVELKQHSKVLSDLLEREKSISNFIEILVDTLQEHKMKTDSKSSVWGESDFIIKLKERLSNPQKPNPDNPLVKELVKLWDSKMGDSSKTKDVKKQSVSPFSEAIQNQGRLGDGLIIVDNLFANNQAYGNRGKKQ